MFPVDKPFGSGQLTQTRPITEIVVNSLIADPIAGAQRSAGGFTVQGIAWDNGHGIRTVEVSTDAGETWQESTLGDDLGRFAFRPCSMALHAKPGPVIVIGTRHQQCGGGAAGEARVQSRRLRQQRHAVADVERGVREARTMYIYAAFVLLLLAAAPARADEQPVDLKPGAGQDVVQNECNICHSLDYSASIGRF